VTAFAERISRADAIAIVDRGGDYVVHASSGGNPRDGYATACGRRLRAVVNRHPAETLVSCATCRRRLARDRSRNPR